MDLRFLQEGTPSPLQRQLSDKAAASRRASSAAVIAEMQRFQNVSYPLASRLEVQSFIDARLRVAMGKGDGYGGGGSSESLSL